VHTPFMTVDALPCDAQEIMQLNSRHFENITNFYMQLKNASYND